MGAARTDKIAGNLSEHESKELLRAAGFAVPHEILVTQKVYLEAAIAREDAEHQAAIEEAKAKGQVPPQFDNVSLRQRAVPFLDMLKRCEEAGKEIVWGV